MAFSRSQTACGLNRWSLGMVCLAVSALSGACVPSALARDLYVDNVLGEDRLDGTASAPQGGPIGPTRSIRRALRYARAGDTIRIENRGVPYFESITLEGTRHSGWERKPFQIISNGAILSGARRVPPTAWIDQGNGLWRFTPDGKGWFLLLRDGRPVPEFAGVTESSGLDPVPVDHWGALRGSIHLRLEAAKVETPADTGYEFAYDQTGISLVDVRDVRIKGLVVRHFRIDGVHAHDRVERAYLESLRLEENGRSGLAVSGTSSVGLSETEVVGNREAAIALREHAWLETEDVTIESGAAAPYSRSEKTTLFVNGEAVAE